MQIEFELVFFKIVRTKNRLLSKNGFCFFLKLFKSQLIGNFEMKYLPKKLLLSQLFGHESSSCSRSNTEIKGNGFDD